jgi:multisubunit Na+/H+ antiporter MnhG subunit
MITITSISIAIGTTLYLLSTLGMMRFLDGNPVVDTSTGQMICAIFWPLTLVAAGCYEVAKFMGAS